MPATQKPRILVFDNDFSTSVLFKHQLSGLFVVDAAAHYSQVTALLDQHARSYVLAFIGLGLDKYRAGVDVLEAVRTRPDCRDLPAIALSDAAHANHEALARRFGFNALLLKPFHADNLTTTIRTVLGGHRTAA